MTLFPWVFLLCLKLCASAAGGPHTCTVAQPQAVYKITDADWCETFCIPSSLVKTVEQFGEVHNGTCTDNGYNTFDHSLEQTNSGIQLTIDMYKLKPAVFVADGPHKCTVAQPQSVYKITDIEWCETFCIPSSLVKTVEQFGDVNNGTCKDAGYNTFDHSLEQTYWGIQLTVDMYKKPGVFVADGPHKCTVAQPQSVYQITDWCQTFCIPSSLVKTVEQSGDVHNGTCTDVGYNTFDYSFEAITHWGIQVTVDMYEISHLGAPLQIIV